MQGRIVKGIAGFYYVYVEPGILYECKAKGIFRKSKCKPLVGDYVEMETISEEERTGNIVQIHDRKNELIRPAVSNIDRALVIFAVAKPKPNYNLLDRFLIMMEKQGIETGICFNKTDAATEEEIAAVKQIYEASGYPVMFTSAKKKEGIEAIRQFLKGRTTTVAGPSGVGKSSLINCLQSNIEMETGIISEKIERGKHTTRHSELIPVEENTFIMDTPGFSSLFVFDDEKEVIKDYFPEFLELQDQCRFQGCMHIHEPECCVKKYVADGKISSSRYESYLDIFEEVKNRKKY